MLSRFETIGMIEMYSVLLWSSSVSRENHCVFAIDFYCQKFPLQHMIPGANFLLCLAWWKFHFPVFNLALIGSAKCSGIAYFNMWLSNFGFQKHKPITSICWSLHATNRWRSLTCTSLRCPKRHKLFTKVWIWYLSSSFSVRRAAVFLALVEKVLLLVVLRQETCSLAGLLGNYDGVSPTTKLKILVYFAIRWYC